MSVTHKPMKRRSFFTAIAGAFALFTAAILQGKDDFPKDSPKFEHSYRSALKKAEKEGKPLVVVFSASWCGPCQAMKKNVYPSEAIKGYHDKFIWAYLDVDDNSNDKAKEEFKVSSIPHIQFLNAKGEPIDKQIGGSAAPENFAKTLDGVLAKAK